MGIESFIQERWSGNIQSRLNDALVFGAVCNSDFVGDVLGSDRVRILMVNSNTTLAAYTPNSTTLTYSAIDGAPIHLNIDRRYTANFKLDDVDAGQIVGDVVGPATNEMGFAIGNDMDQFIAAKYAEAMAVSGLGTAGTPINVTSLNIIEYLGLVSQRLDEANVPQEGRWMVINPWFKHKIELADITLNTDNSNTLANGFMGRALGFGFYVSNNVSEATASTHAGARIMAGYSGTMTLAQQIAKVEQVRDIQDFATYYRALNVYGVKVVRPNALACLRATYTAEP